jgi:hypothetical protein
MTIAHDSEKVFARAQQAERFGPRGRKDSDPGPFRHIAAAEFSCAESGIEEPRWRGSRAVCLRIERGRLESCANSDRYFPPCHALETWLGLHEVNIRSKAERQREIAAPPISIARDIREFRY